MVENPVVWIEASTFDSETGDWTSVIVKGRSSFPPDRRNPLPCKEICLVGPGRLELPTSSLSGMRSNRAELWALFCVAV